MTDRPPNILFLMVDQLAASALPVYGHRLVKAPNIAALAARGVVFDSAYCNFPICAPSRFSMLSGRLPHAIEAYDNASEFPASIPTMAHYLREAGYRTILCGKMHFIGPDQLHGYEERLTTDIYPADFGWTPDFLKGPSYRPTGVSMRGVVEAGPCVRSLQIDYDDEVEYRAVQKIHDLARTPEDQPFFLTVSFTHPHPPFVSTQRHWDLYRDEDIDMPRVGPIPYEALDVHSQWLFEAHAQGDHDMTPERIRRARHAYYGMVSYVDEKLGSVLQALAQTGLDQNTLVVLAGDHGEMLGERGMWYKQTFFEDSVRVPLIMAAPESQRARWMPRPAESSTRGNARGDAASSHRISAHVSLVDLLPTFLDLARPGEPHRCVDPIDGRSLVPLLTGEDSGQDRQVISEYSSEGVRAASRMLREGAYKYVLTRGLKPLLFDLDADPEERHDLAGQQGHAAIEAAMHARLVRDWDPELIHERILASQRRRAFLAQVMAQSGRYPNWAYQPFTDESKRFIRGAGGAGPTQVKSRARFPWVKPVDPDRKPG